MKDANVTIITFAQQTFSTFCVLCGPQFSKKFPTTDLSRSQGDDSIEIDQ